MECEGRGSLYQKTKFRYGLYEFALLRYLLVTNIARVKFMSRRKIMPFTSGKSSGGVFGTVATMDTHEYPSGSRVVCGSMAAFVSRRHTCPRIPSDTLKLPAGS